MKWVYFCRSDSDGRVRIGCTETIAIRLQSLRSHCSGKIQLIGLRRGGYEVEAAYHDRFVAARVYGEWFNPIHELLIEAALWPVPKNLSRIAQDKQENLKQLSRTHFTNRHRRANEMAVLYKAGHTLQEIGHRYDLTRERVRQIMTQRFGITAKDGGAVVRAAAQIARAVVKATDGKVTAGELRPDLFG